MLLAAIDAEEQQEDEDQVNVGLVCAMAAAGLVLGQHAAIMSGQVRFRSYFTRANLADMDESSWFCILNSTENRDAGFLRTTGLT
jgi:hypothetical protein